MSDPFSAPISRQIWDMKYQFKDAFTGAVHDHTVEDTWRRIAKALAEPEKDPAKWEKEFYEALSDFKFLPAGRIIAGAGTGRNVTLFNCYVMGTIPDSMGGIFDSLKEAALTMQQGGGIGYDFSPLRPKNAPVKGVAADASGPITFMDVWDAMCRTVMSAGSRRGAMMATMRCDHPDVLEFISAKSDPLRLRMFNLSVLCSDKFMEAVRADTVWELCHEVAPEVEPAAGLMRVGTDGETRWVYDTIRARDLWEKIMQSTYDFAEPGVIFVDRINQTNNLKYMENISASNPCGEQPLPPYGACLLGSINLTQLVEKAFTDEAGIDRHKLEALVRIAVRMMDNVNDVSKFPLSQQRDEALNKRRIGLGITGLADALIMCGLTYGTQEAADRAESWSKMIAEAAYWSSIDLAREKGPFPALIASEYLREGTFVAENMSKDMHRAIRNGGIRNSHLLSIAPCGTISLYAGNVSSGIEPVFAYSYTRKVLQKDGTKTEERVTDYATSKYHSWRVENNVQDKELPAYFVNAQTLEPLQHVMMQAAVQKWIDTSISKTINMPEDVDFEAFKEVYWAAFDADCKGCTTYRPNEITGTLLTVDEPEEPSEEAPEETPPRHLPNEIKVSFSEVEPLSDEEEGIDTIDTVRRFLFSGNPSSRDKRKGWLRTWLSMYGAERVVDLSPGHRGMLISNMTSYDRVAEWHPDSLYAWTEGEAEQDLSARINSAEVEQELSARISRAVGVDDPHPSILEAMAERTSLTAEPVLTSRPDELPASVYKVKIGSDPAFYVTVADIEEDGQRRPFEVFINTKNPEHIAWTTALTMMISAIFRRPHDSSFVVEELKGVFDPRGGGFWKGAYRPSIAAAIGQVIQDHMTGIGYGSFAQGGVNSEMAEPYQNPEPSGGPTDGPGLREDEVAVVLTPSGPICPKCYSFNLKHESGCDQCIDCGHSSCG